MRYKIEALPDHWTYVAYLGRPYWFWQSSGRTLEIEVDEEAGQFGWVEEDASCRMTHVLPRELS